MSYLFAGYTFASRTILGMALKLQMVWILAEHRLTDDVTYNQ
jgi:hypothetical protein